jgi:hypothetical protein
MLLDRLVVGKSFHAVTTQFEGIPDTLPPVRAMRDGQIPVMHRAAIRASASHFALSFIRQESGMVRLLDARGKACAHVKFVRAANCRINAERLPAGIYIVTIERAMEAGSRGLAVVKP